MKKNRNAGENMAHSNGITLITLIVTIIILLILAGVTINVLIGDNGLFKTAKKAGESYQKAGIRETIEAEILAMSTEKIIKGEALTVEQALIGINKKGTFEEIDLYEKTGTIQDYIVTLGYNENGKVVIEDIEKYIGTRITVKLTPSGYTNENVEIEIGVKPSEIKITNIEVPEGMTKKENGKYEVVKNGTYLVKVTLENGQILDKEIKIGQIDKLRPKEFKPKTEITENGFIIEAQTEDLEATSESGKSGIDYYEYYVDNEKQSGKEITGLSQGTYKVYVIAYDNAGNDRKSEEIEVKITKKIVQVSAYLHTLALDEDGRMYAWGAGSSGQLGDGTTIRKNTPVEISNRKKFEQVMAGISNSFALDDEGKVWAWGENFCGIFGTTDSVTWCEPTALKIDKRFTTISSRGEHMLALDTDGTAWAWGYGGEGQLGDGKSINTCSTPSEIETSVKFVKVIAGGRCGYAIDESGYLWSWGAGWDGRLGNGKTDWINKPEKIIENVKFKEIDGWEHALAIDENGNIWAWGNNNDGQVGDGTTEDRLIPKQITENVEFVKIAVSINSSIAIDVDGNIWIWGAESGSTNPEKMESEVRFKEIYTGWADFFAIDTNGFLWAWGDNQEGGLGDGTGYSRKNPVQVDFE